MPVYLREFAQRGLHLDGAWARRPRGHEGATPLLWRDQALAVQHLDRLPHRDPRQREFLDQLLERRQARAGPPDAAFDAPAQQVRKLRVAWQGPASEDGLDDGDHLSL